MFVTGTFENREIYKDVTGSYYKNENWLGKNVHLTKLNIRSKY